MNYSNTKPSAMVNTGESIFRFVLTAAFLTYTCCSMALTILMRKRKQRPVSILGSAKEKSIVLPAQYS